MKLRTKLIIAFVVVMIFPVTFALIAMHAFVPGRGAVSYTHLTLPTT